MVVSPLSSGTLSSAPQGARNVPQVEVCATAKPGETLLRIAGKGCAAYAEVLAAYLLGLTARRPSLVLLDLSGLSCISSLTMGVLVTFHRGVVRAGGRVRLVEALQQPVRAALERAGLFTLFGSLQESESGAQS